MPGVPFPWQGTPDHCQLSPPGQGLGRALDLRGRRPLVSLTGNQRRKQMSSDVLPRPLAGLFLGQPSQGARHGRATRALQGRGTMPLLRQPQRMPFATRCSRIEDMFLQRAISIAMGGNCVHRAAFICIIWI